MQFGVFVATKIDDWQYVQELEAMGYDAAWLGDTQMLWSDCYATLALAAVNTKRIRIGPGVAVAATRIAPVTAHSIASINRLAPGRVFLGLGTGHTSMRSMGMDPMRVADFMEYVRVVRALLRGEEVNYTLNGVTRVIRFLHQENEFVNIADPIPIYIAAIRPRSLRAAGALGDGMISTSKPQKLKEYLVHVHAGAAQAGRTLPESFHAASLTTVLVLKPGEKLTSDRVIDLCGPPVITRLRLFYEMARYLKDPSVVPPDLRNVYEEYYEYAESMPVPPEKRYMWVHAGHATHIIPEERRFVTPEAIRSSAWVGEPDELIEHLRAAEKAGLKEVGILPPNRSRVVVKDFAEQVMSRYR